MKLLDLYLTRMRAIYLLTVDEAGGVVRWLENTNGLENLTLDLNLH